MPRFSFGDFIGDCFGLGTFRFAVGLGLLQILEPGDEPLRLRHSVPLPLSCWCRGGATCARIDSRRRAVALASLVRETKQPAMPGACGHHQRRGQSTGQVVFLVRPDIQRRCHDGNAPGFCRQFNGPGRSQSTGTSSGRSTFSGSSGTPSESTGMIAAATRWPSGDMRGTHPGPIHANGPWVGSSAIQASAAGAGESLCVSTLPSFRPCRLKVSWSQISTRRHSRLAC